MLENGINKAMRIACTHEQADFDAIASLMGVALLDPDIHPVLPRRINRNVQAFLNLYSGEMPFIKFNDLPRLAITQLTLVDTQSAPSVKGFKPETTIHVIDHHAHSPDLDPTWTTHIEEVGATATLLVEQLRNSSTSIAGLEATLLLLGIYEDTGSLTYAATTTRDIQACAWLFDQGAQITLLSEFLDHPLTNGQKELYKRLVDTLESYEIHGLTVLVAAGEAQGLTEEISTLAHKLRDLYDPDGLFVLVALDSHIQLVARSTTHALDVSRIAEAFGGGGHLRAAAALIKDRSMDEIRHELLSILESAIEPARTVAEIMSRDPQLLDPDLRIEDAAERMQRFGHEGYPVVRAGQVLGLLTRRAVDRAINHGMGQQPISRVMKAGDVSLASDKPINVLQDLMIEHGWGQIPVTDPKTGVIIGIVTRTDLISALGTGLEGDEDADLLATLEAALPKARLSLLFRIAELAEERKDALYIVGGFVRDLLLGSPSVDFDLVVEGDAIGLAQSLALDLGGRVSSHRRFGTAKWQLDLEDKRLIALMEKSGAASADLPGYLDFVTARTEFYSHPTALPSVERGSIKLDLHRRDFTINTLAMRLDQPYRGQLLDYWGGGRDLREKKIRVLHSISFVDDPTRILRAIRLEQRLRFEIESRTLELLREAVALLDRVSGERIRNELNAIFHEEEHERALERLEELDLLSAIHDGLVWDEWLQQRFRLVKTFSTPKAWEIDDPADMIHLIYSIWLIRLEPRLIEAISKRLRFTGALRADILDAHRLCQFLCEMPENLRVSEIVERLDDCRERSLITAYLALEPGSEAQDAMQTYLTKWRKVQPMTTGDDLRERGLPPGPRYREILWNLRAGWLDGEIANQTKEVAMLDAYLEAGVSDG
jgi:tRNA nucleotidyltransferase (CCA-adding enzyme)